MKIDLSNKKVGDTVFNVINGLQTITKKEYYYIWIDSTSYLTNGRYVEDDVHPSIFNDKEECAMYFAEVAGLLIDKILL